MTSYSLLLKKLDAFIRKYYKNLLIRGAMYFALAVLISFLLIVLLEYFGQYNTLTRTVLFYAFVIFTAYCLVRFVVTPLMGMYKLGKLLTHQHASAIIGKHFPDVKDRLLNTLQLKNEADNQHNLLLEAAINQKAEQLKPINFSEAINLKHNLKHLRLVAIPLLVYGVIYLFAPAVITNGSQRIINYNQVFTPQAPFTFTLENKELSVLQFGDIEITVSLNGNLLPDEVYMMQNEQEVKMQKVEKNRFTYTLRNVNKNIPFKFSAANFFSKEYLLQVLQKPIIINYKVLLKYPGYLNKTNQTLENPGDITLPAGTQATWYFSTLQTDKVYVSFDNKAIEAKQDNATTFSFEKKLFTSSSYSIKGKNNSFGFADSLAYNIQVIPDAFPSISVDEQADSVTGRQLFFIGDVGDDYGLTKLIFAYQFTKSEIPSKTQQGIITKTIAIDKSEKSQRFYYQFNLGETGLSASDELIYYFEVWDNDGIRGAKSSRSKTNVFKAATNKELREQMNEAGKSLKNNMEQAIKESKQLQKELKELQLKMLEKRELTWEEKKKAEELMKRQQMLAQKIEEIKNQNEKNNLKEQELNKPNPELLEKQQQIEKMFNELMNDDMKKLLKEMEKLMQQQNKDAVKQEMEKMQLNNKDVEKELDRMLEQFKQLELDKKLTDAIEQTKQLANEQKKLADKNEQLQTDKQLNKDQKQVAQEELKQQQQKLNNEFKELQQQLKDIEKTNSELEEPKELSETQKQEEKINTEQQQAKENLDKKDNKKAKENQENAAEELEKMAADMKEKQEQEEKEQHEEDAEALREILENTIQLSKDQEQLIEDMNRITGYSPQYVDLAKQQKTTRDNAKIIEDSLTALSKRVPEISSFINREVTKLNNNLEKSITAYAQRNFMSIRTSQQYAMTSANNLAVMLSEVLNQMQQQSQQQKGKKGGKPSSKPKPGQGKGSKPMSMSQLKKMQEELNKQLREGLNKQGEQGKPQDKLGGKPGGQQQGGMSSESFAKMAAQQMAIRQQMQKMMQQMGAKEKEGLGGSKLLEEMKQLMEQTERELFNKKITGQLLQRQQDILTRLLESEKAERKQEQEEKREAEQAKERPKVSPPQFNLYIQQKNKEKELLETIPADMQPYYKEKSKSYFNNIGIK